MTNSLGLPQRKTDVLDISMFDPKGFSDIDLDVILCMTDDKTVSSVLEDQILPMMKRRIKDASMDDVVKTVLPLQQALHQKYDNLLQTSSKVIFDSVVDEEMSVESMREYSKKQLAYEAEDYWLFDEFLQEHRYEVDKPVTIEQRFRNRYNALSEFMFEWDMRLFKYSKAESVEESIAYAYNKVFWKYMEDKDFQKIAGLGDAEWYITKNVGKRHISKKTAKMMECLQAFNRHKYTEYTVQEVLR